MLKGFPSRRDNIILATVDIINESGLQGLSTKRLAAKQGISESILYKHFESLDQVLVAVVEYFSQFDTAIMNTVTAKEIPYKEKLILFVKSFVELYDSYPAITGVLLHYEALIRHQYTSQIATDVFVKRSEFILNLIRAGQGNGEISNYYTPEELLDIINGIMVANAIRWKISGYNYSLKGSTLNNLKKVLDRS